MEIHSKIDVNNEKWHNLKMEGGSKYSPICAIGRQTYTLDNILYVGSKLNIVNRNTTAQHYILYEY